MMTVPLVLITAVVLIVLVRQRRELSMGAGGWFLFVIGIVRLAPITAAKLTNSYEYGLDVDGALVVTGYGWAGQLYQFADIATLIAAVLMLITTARRRIFVSVPFLAIAGIVLTSSLVALFFRPTLTQAIPLILVLAAAGTFTTSARDAIRGAAWLTLVMSIAGTVIAIVNPTAAFNPCLDKCTFIGEIFSGAVTHGNSLAIFLTLGLPFVWMAFTGKSRILMIGYVFFLIVISGSRTSLASALLVLVVLLVVAPRTDAAGRGRGRNLWFASSIGFALAVAALVVPLATSGEFATGRGYLWEIARQAISQSLLFGDGAGAWTRFYDEGLFGRAAAYSTHNQWMEVLLQAGLIGGALFAVFLGAMLFARDKEARALTAPLVVAALALGILERPIAIDGTNEFTWALVGMLIVANTSRRRAFTGRLDAAASRSTRESSMQVR